MSKLTCSYTKTSVYVAVWGEGARWCEAGGVSPLGSNDGGGSGAGVSKDGRHSARVRKEGSVHEPITPTVRG